MESVFNDTQVIVIGEYNVKTDDMIDMQTI